MKTITIFGSSSENIPDTYKMAAFRLGELIAKAGWQQYNGGGNCGVMGHATLGGLSKGGIVHGVIIDVYKQSQATGLTSCISVEQFHERKLKLMEAGDVIVALPGGIGTLNEIFHVLDDLLSEQYQGRKINPLLLLNTNGFYDGLLDWMRSRILRESFLSNNSFQQIFQCSDSVEGIVELINHYIR